jgi:hypothetical protein
VIWLRANGSHGTGTFVSDISILLLTYGRLAYATRTLETVLNFAHTNQHTLSVHIASDGDENDYVQVLRSICMNREVLIQSPIHNEVATATTTISPPR